MPAGELGEWAQHKVVMLVSHTVPDKLTISHSFVFKRTEVEASPGGLSVSDPHT